MKAKITINEAKQAKQEDKRDLSSDIFTAGNVVVSQDGVIILVVNNNPYIANYFAGVEIAGAYFSDSWFKKDFAQFHGNIVISTEG